MNKAVIYTGVGLGVALLAYIAYRYIQNPTQTYSTTSVNPGSQPNYTTDPYQSYPFQANIPPRMDNSNQPWANNNRAAINGVSSPQIDVNLTNAAMLADVLKSGKDIIDSGQSIWNSVSSWFDDGDLGGLMGDWGNGDVGSTDWSWA